MSDQQDPEIQKLEQQLADLSPSPLSEDLISRMSAAMDSWEQHLPLEEKIVPFDTETAGTSTDSANAAQSVAKPTTKKKSSFHIWSAAAAIALMAAVGALFITPSDKPENLADTQKPQQFTTSKPTVASSSPSTPKTIDPEQFSHQLTNASHQGITYAADNKPYRVFRIEYTIKDKKVDADGKTTKTSEPAVQILLIPVKENQ